MVSNLREKIRKLILEKTRKNPHQNFTILEEKKDGSYKVKVLWAKGKEEIIDIKI